MGGITTGVGIFSGINTSQLIDQLIAIESRPKQLAQARVLQLQQQQAAWLDLNSKVQSLKAAAAAFRTANIFKTNAAGSSDEHVLTATAGVTATPGSYQFIVDRLVSTQQFLSRGFANSTARLSISARPKRERHSRRLTCVCNCDASRSTSINPRLCRVFAYSGPGFPRPTISQLSTSGV